MKIIQNRNKFFMFSIVIILIGIIAMPVNYFMGNGMLNFDIEFTGGTAMHFNIGNSFDNNDVFQLVRDSTGQSSPQIQQVIGKNEVLIKTQTLTEEQRNDLITKMNEKYSLTDENLLTVTEISGTISGEMQRTALIAILISCVAMLIYISIRFKNLPTGASAIFALLHDVLVVLAVYSVFRIPVNNFFVAAVLTILGYSINATIVVFDRIRENKRHYRRDEVETLINTSISQTLGRSINTSLTTLFTITCIYIFGVQSVKDFAFPLIIGILAGTYSSVFLSGSIWYVITTKFKKSPTLSKSN